MSLDLSALERGLVGGSEPEWLVSLRADARARFLEMGLPGPDLEDWKYSNPAALAETRFAQASEASVLALVEALRLPSAAVELVFVNGRHVPDLDRWAALPAGATVRTFGQALVEQPDVLAETVGRHATMRERSEAFVALNTAFLQDGAFVRLERNVVVEAPIHLIFVATGAASQPRVALRADRGSRVCIVENHVAMGTDAGWANVVAEIAVEDGAAVEHHLWQQGAKSAFFTERVQADVARDARYSLSAFSFGGRFSRADLRAALCGPGAEVQLDGLEMVGTSEHVDHHTTLDHKAPHGTSRESWRAVAGGQGRAVFNGRVVVHPGAKKTDAAQSSHNVLLSRTARIDARPELEIYDDDVKCAHGTSVGRLDEEAVWYLRSRGIGEKEARRMLVEGFVASAIEAVRPDLQEALRTRVEMRLPDLFPEEGA